MPRPISRSAAEIWDPVASGPGSRTETFEAVEYEDYRVSTRPAIELPAAAPPAIAIPSTTTPSTVIPVPSLPTIDATHKSRMEPVVRTAQAATTTGRFAKGTGTVDPPPPPRPSRRSALVVDDPMPDLSELSVGDRTRPGMVLPPSDDRTRPGIAVAPSGDRTRPGIALPPAARTVELPSIKRRSAPR